MRDMDDDFDLSMRQLLLDDAVLFSGLEGATLQDGVNQALRLAFPDKESLRNSLRTKLFAANQRQSFVLDAETAIPHVVLHDHKPVAGWFRSINGFAESGNAAIRTVFFAAAADPVLKHAVALACRILMDGQFRIEFNSAATGKSLRLALATAFERQIAREVDTSAMLERRAQAILASHSASAGNGNLYIDYFLVENLRGLHARFSAKVVQCVEQYDCNTVVFSAHGDSVGGLSVMGLMMLALGPGHVVEVVIEGRQAFELGSHLARLFAEEAERDAAERRAWQK
jgi:phosphocarrier protein